MTEIDWQTLETHDGAATSVPVWLDELSSTSATVRKQALANLSEALNHQGTPTRAGAAALPLLLELCFDKAVKDKDQLLVLCVDLACAGSHVRWLQGPAMRGGKNAHALTQHIGSLEKLLGERAGGTRAAAALALGFAGPAAAEPLRRRLATDKDDAVRASIVLALGRHLGDLPEGAPAASSLEALARTVVNAWWAEQWADWGAEVLAALKLYAQPQPKLPWAGGDPGALLGQAVAGKLESLTSAELSVCLEGLRASWGAGAVAARLIHALFPADTAELPHVPRDSRELTVKQAQTLSAIAGEPFVNGSDCYYALQDHGLPARPKELARYLNCSDCELEPRDGCGALDTRVAEAPCWLWLRRELMARERGESAGAIKALSGLGDERLLAVALEAARGDYLLVRRWPWSDRLQPQEYEFGADLGLLLVDLLVEGCSREALEAYAQPMLATPQYALIRAVLFSALAKACGAALPEPFELLFQQGISYTRVLRRGLTELSDEAKDRILLAQQIGHQVQGARVVAYGLWLYADLAPTSAVAERVLAAAKDWKPDEPVPSEAKGVLQVLRDTHPELVTDWMAATTGFGRDHVQALIS